MKVWRDANQKPGLGAILNPDAPINPGKEIDCPFNEASGGRAANLAKTGNVGALTGGLVWTPGGLVLPAGKTGSVDLIGTLPYDNFSLMWTCRVADATTDSYFVSWGTLSGHDIICGYVNNAFEMHLFNRANSAIVIPDAGWHTYAYTYDGTTFRSYRDGVKIGENTVAPTTTAMVNPRLFTANDVIWWLTNTLGSFTGWSRALSLNEGLGITGNPYGFDQYLVPGIPVYYSIPAGVTGYGPLVGDGNLIGGGVLVGAGGLV